MNITAGFLKHIIRRYPKNKKENVKLQIEQLNSYPQQKKTIDEKREQVHIHYYNFGNGALIRVIWSSTNSINLFFYPVKHNAPDTGKFSIHQNNGERGKICLHDLFYIIRYTIIN